MPTAQSPSGDQAVYTAHFKGALAEWIRTGVLGLEALVERLDFKHPTAEELAAASSQSQDGSIAFTLNPSAGEVTVGPAIPILEPVAPTPVEGEAIPPTAEEIAAAEAVLAKAGIHVDEPVVNPPADPSEGTTPPVPPLAGGAGSSATSSS